MEDILVESDAYRDAKRHVERKIGFFIHLTVFLAVNTGLILFNLLLAPHKLWAFWPLFGWGIGLLFHGLGVFVHAPGAAWKRQMIEKELKKQSHP
jgi:hypothetical protein